MRCCRLAAPLLLCATLALAAGCGGQGANGANGAQGDRTPAPTVAVTSFGHLSQGVSTTFTLDEDFLRRLDEVGVRVFALGDATLSHHVLTLPITGGNLQVFDKFAVDPYVQGRVDHRGSGLALQTATAEVELTDLVMTPDVSLMSGELTDDDRTGDAELFRLDGSTLQPLRTEDGHDVLDGTRVSLHPAGAALLRRALDLDRTQLPDGLFLGVAKITAAG